MGDCLPLLPLVRRRVKTEALAPSKSTKMVLGVGARAHAEGGGGRHTGWTHDRFRNAWKRNLRSEFSKVLSVTRWWSRTGNWNQARQPTDSDSDVLALSAVLSLDTV